MNVGVWGVLVCRSRFVYLVVYLYRGPMTHPLLPWVRDELHVLLLLVPPRPWWEPCGRYLACGLLVVRWWDWGGWVACSSSQ